MTVKNDGGPAFPRPRQVIQGMPDIDKGAEGMSLRVYAAIKLKQPDSGIDWLDEMILKTKRDEVAAKAMQGLISACNSDGIWTGCGDKKMNDNMAITAYMVADSMLKAGEEK